MANREQINRVDAQWQRAQSAWGPKDNEGERKMLYDLLEPGEDVELLQACSFETKNVGCGPPAMTGESWSPQGAG
jgi:hypothetical protein